MAEEIWKGVKGYEDLYEVSSFGRVRSLPRTCRKLEGREMNDYIYQGKMLRPYRDKKGYLSVRLYRKRIAKDIKVHRLVAQTFIQNPDHLPQINHKDENKANNRADNLEWCTNLYNRNYGSNGDRSKIKVAQYDKSGNLIAVYPSVKFAALAVGVAPTNISGVLHGLRKTSGGFVWKAA